jgi:uncharacterized membrane protein
LHFDTAGLEEFVRSVTLLVAFIIDIGVVVVIALASSEAIARALFVFTKSDRGLSEMSGIRIRLGRWLSMALEFEIGSDILRTAVAPSWNDIGQLAAIVVLRTAIEWTLQRDIRQEAEESGRARETAVAAEP